MLRKSAITAADKLTVNCINAGVMLEAIPSTPLAILVDSSYIPQVDDPTWIGDKTRQDIIEGIARGIELPTFDAVPIHERVMEEQTHVVARTVRDNLYYARNVVNPIIDAVANDVKRGRATEAQAIANVLSVMPDTYEAIWKDNTLLSLVERYADIPKLNNITIPAIHPGVTIDQLMTMMKTGISSLDRAVVDWVAEIGPDFVMSVYNDYFIMGTEGGEGRDPTSNVSYLTGVGPIPRKRALVVFLLAYNMSKHIMDGINMPALEYESRMTGVMAQAGRSINAVLEHRERNQTFRSLIVGWPWPGAEYFAQASDTSQIVVNGDVYADWLADGGKPEILMGAFILDKCDSYSKLLSDAERYETAWRTRCGLVRSAQRSELYARTLSQLRAAVARQINAIPDEQLINGSRAPMHAALEVSLRKATIMEAEDLYKMSQRVVCESMFPHRDVKLILDTIDDIAAKEPGLSVREVATLATIHIVTGWVAQFIIRQRS